MTTIDEGSDTVVVMVDGERARIKRGAGETRLPDGRVLRAQWGETMPETLLQYEVVPGPTPREARRADRTGQALLVLIEATSREHIAASIACSEAYQDGADEQARAASIELVQLTKNTYHFLVDALASYVAFGLSPAQVLAQDAERYRAHCASLADAAERARSRVAAALG